MGSCLPGLIMAAQESWKNTGMLAGVADCEGVRNGAAEEDLCWDLNPGAQSCGLEIGGSCGSGAVWTHVVLGLCLLCSLGSWKVRRSSNAELSFSSLEECRRDAAGRKGVKGLSLVGREKVPHVFGLRSGDPSDTADDAGNCGRPASLTGKNRGLPEPQISISFPKIQYL